MFKYLMIVATAMFVATPALADLNVNGEVTDTYKKIINKTPYSVEVCTDVHVPGDKTSDMLTGAIIGGIIGNNVTKDLPDGGTAGAIIGGILGHNNSTATGTTQRRCTFETRYNEEYQEVYSHSNITFTLNGQVYTVRFKKRS
tara:strand:+ start:41 stop:469 length:429 start_codon:yes stop_codon:yes gene_type:complete